MVSDTGLLTPTFAQTDNEEGKFEEIYPITFLDDAASVEFRVKNYTDKFMDLAISFVKVKCKIVESNCQKQPPEVFCIKRCS